jgi:hypothetical protein
VSAFRGRVMPDAADIKLKEAQRRPVSDFLMQAITTMSIAHNQPAKLPLDEHLYFLEGEELVFFQEQTGIKDKAELKRHILVVQEKAYKAWKYFIGLLLC